MGLRFRRNRISPLPIQNLCRTPPHKERCTNYRRRVNTDKENPPLQNFQFLETCALYSQRRMGLINHKASTVAL